ncbi:hypothetical protein [Marinagarivorans cellulosilyticus]|uniref:Uncharacterized protein n=1 Tax=Marinagarivorans cellulosilyticus TaxID=2721545 RepID=A0AAN2BLW0_9GAMM|nr:hypothetical protein [Marinagarivorans cellulosilyticus]BCD99499.1 hypothetical protein MARGE09_P3701 [Marinagarivorans cellulosilyticus]
MTDSKSSDYGEIFLDLCDSDLRRNVVGTLVAARKEEAAINQDQLNEIAAYLNRLEDALVRHHTGELKTANVLEHLLKCTGLDVSGLAFSMESMYAEDA